MLESRMYRRYREWAKLPPNVFSNVPLAKAGEAANILLLDSLNTQMADQSYVHAQMIKYIKDIRPGTRLAIFTLSDRLRFVQGFTEDPALLMAAVNGKNIAGNPELSPLLQTGAEQTANQQAVGQMQRLAASSGRGGAAEIQAGAAALGRFQSENVSSQTGVRANLTLQAINQLAMYLQAIPGRKNVIWFTGSFPLSTLSSDPNMLRDVDPEVAKTANLLAAACIAIYPIGVGAMGLAPSAIYDSSASAASTSITGARTYGLSDPFPGHRINRTRSEQCQPGGTGRQYGGDSSSIRTASTMCWIRSSKLERTTTP
jgi:VWFA-related protein